MRDYLVEIYRLTDRLGDDGAYVSTSALADLLRVTPPAVNHGEPPALARTHRTRAVSRGSA
ncbi:MAG: hypothetical protein HND48_05840 [Chloroflexi bacterium]|nr:hypothetical protein [Chloroflexota bacterium]